MIHSLIQEVVKASTGLLSGSGGNTGSNSAVDVSPATVAGLTSDKIDSFVDLLRGKISVKKTCSSEVASTSKKVKLCKQGSSVAGAATAVHLSTADGASGKVNLIKGNSKKLLSGKSTDVRSELVNMVKHGGKGQTGGEIIKDVRGKILSRNIKTLLTELDVRNNKAVISPLTKLNRTASQSVEPRASDLKSGYDAARLSPNMHHVDNRAAPKVLIDVFHPATGRGSSNPIQTAMPDNHSGQDTAVRSESTFSPADNPGQKGEQSLARSPDAHPGVTRLSEASSKPGEPRPETKPSDKTASRTQATIAVSRLAAKFNMNVAVERTEPGVPKKAPAVKQPKGTKEAGSEPPAAASPVKSKGGQSQKNSPASPVADQSKGDVSTESKPGSAGNNPASGSEHSADASRTHSTAVNQNIQSSAYRPRIQPEPVVDHRELISGIKVKLDGGQSELVLRLRPHILGSALIRLSQGKEGLKLEFQVARPEAIHAIEAEVSNLKDALNNAGILIASVEVRSSNPDSERFTQTSGDRSPNRQQSDRDQSHSDRNYPQDKHTRSRDFGYNTFEIAA